MQNSSHSNNFSIAVVVALNMFGYGCFNEKSASFIDGSLPYQPTAQESADLRRIVVQDFFSGTIEKDRIEVDTGFKLIESIFTLSQTPKTTEMIKQKERKMNSIEFTQGFDGWPIQQSFSTKEKGKLDLLIVVDDSDSMADMQKKLANNMAPLLKYITNTNWQIGVVTTSSACLQKTKSGKRSVTRSDFDSNPTDAENIFKELIQVGKNGTTSELGILYSTQGLIGNCGNPKDPWTRPGSQKIVLLITDEKNCGSASNEGDNGDACRGKEFTKAEYFTRYAPPHSQVYGLLLLKDNFTLCPDSGGYGPDQYPDEYIKLINMTGGKYGEICQLNYSTLLEEISSDIDQDTVQTFELDYAPDKDRISILIDGLPFTEKFNVDDRFIRINSPLPVKSLKAEISYVHGSKIRLSAFKLPSVPDERSIKIAINGKRTNSGEYRFNSVNNTLDFAIPPPDLASITIEFRDPTPLDKSFALTADRNIIPSSLEIKISGKPSDNYTYNFSTNTLTFTLPPLDGEMIQISFAKKGDKITHYNISGIAPESIEQAVFLDADNSEVLNARIDGSQIIFDENDVFENRLVIARYNPIYPLDRQQFNVKLGHTPMDNDFSITSNGPIVDACGDQIFLDENNNLKFNCHDEDMSRISIEYSYINNYTNRFIFRGIPIFNAVWKVQLNDVETTDYERVGNQFLIPEELLPPGTKVSITRIPPTTQ